jgi:hypothetical protein
MAYATNLKTNDLIYNLNDLVALEKEGNTQEFFLHFNDLRPSERNQIWKKMVENMATSFVDKKLLAKEWTKENFDQLENLNRLPLLKNEEVFQFKRDLFSKNYLKNCFELNSAKINCEQEINSYWDNSRKDPEIALSLVEIIENYHSKLPTWSFYSLIIKDQIAPIYCKRPNVQHAILNFLNKETFSEDFDNDYKKLIGKNIPSNCIKELIPVLKEALISSQTNGLQKEQALQILQSQGQLTSTDKNFYLTIYLLDAPVVGEQMNLAWKFIESLSENYKERTRILEEFGRIPLIPDKTFSDPKSTRNKAIIGLFAKNFPELLNYYAKSCLDFLNAKEGSKANSNIQCHQFLKTAQELKSDKINWISDSISSSYSAIKK